MSFLMEKVQERVTLQMNEKLAAPFTTEEVMAALKHMHPTKPPGPDEIPTLFYKNLWPTIGSEVISYVL